MTVDKHEESVIRHRTENELSKAYYTYFGVNPIKTKTND
jgi:hypothetical protein